MFSGGVFQLPAMWKVLVQVSESKSPLWQIAPEVQLL